MKFWEQLKVYILTDRLAEIQAWLKCVTDLQVKRP